MKKYIYTVLFATAMLQGKTFDNIKFIGDIDLLTGEFDRATLLKICHIEYPAIYKSWIRFPYFINGRVLYMTNFKQSSPIKLPCK